MASDSQIVLGQTVYDDDGNELGTVRGFNEDGFVVTTRTDAGRFTVEHEHAPHDLGEAQLMWRCDDCGEMGDIDDVPETCPNCGAPAEAIYWWTED